MKKVILLMAALLAGCSSWGNRPIDKSGEKARNAVNVLQHVDAMGQLLDLSNHD